MHEALQCYYGFGSRLRASVKAADEYGEVVANNSGEDGLGVCDGRKGSEWYCVFNQQGYAPAPAGSVFADNRIIGRREFVVENIGGEPCFGDADDVGRMLKKQAFKIF